MVYIGSEAKWRLYYEGGVKKKKKILALAGAKGRHKNMFSAVISTAATQLVRVKEDEAKEKKRARKKTPKSRSPWVHSSAPYLGIISVFFSFFFFFFFVFFFCGGGRVQYYSNVC